jgi:hypothetical protein
VRRDLERDVLLGEHAEEPAIRRRVAGREEQHARVALTDYAGFARMPREHRPRGGDRGAIRLRHRADDGHRRGSAVRDALVEAQLHLGRGHVRVAPREVHERHRQVDRDLARLGA